MLLDIKRTIPANSSNDIACEAEFVRCIESDQAEFLIKLDDGQEVFFAQGCQVKVAYNEQKFKKITIQNNNASSLEVRLIYGTGQFEDDRLQSSGNVSSEEVSPPTVDDDPNKAVPTGVQTTILNENPNRAVLYLTNLEPIGGHTVYVGRDPSGGRGIPLPPQTPLPIATTAKVRCWHDAGYDIDIGLCWTEWS